MVVKSGVETEDINRLDKDNYIILFNKYKSKIEKANFTEKIKLISQCKEEKEYEELSFETQDKLFMELMSIKGR